MWIEESECYHIFSLYATSFGCWTDQLFGTPHVGLCCTCIIINMKHTKRERLLRLHKCLQKWLPKNFKIFLADTNYCLTCIVHIYFRVSLENAIHRRWVWQRPWNTGSTGSSPGHMSLVRGTTRQWWWTPCGRFPLFL